jgi:hypothetical protein
MKLGLRFTLIFTTCSFVALHDVFLGVIIVKFLVYMIIEPFEVHVGSGFKILNFFKNILT